MQSFTALLDLNKSTNTSVPLYPIDLNYD